jgi:hypothetical protein
MTYRRLKTFLLDDIGLLRMDWKAGHGVEEHCNGCGENAAARKANRSPDGAR